jgi:hypothetical protein
MVLANPTQDGKQLSGRNNYQAETIIRQDHKAKAHSNGRERSQQRASNAGKHTQVSVCAMLKQYKQNPEFTTPNKLQSRPYNEGALVN